MDIRKIPIYGFIVMVQRKRKLRRLCKEFPSSADFPLLENAQDDVDCAYRWTVGFIIGLIGVVEILVLPGGK